MASDIRITFTWRPDIFGKPDTCLYAGNLYAGEVRDETAIPKRPLTRGPWRAWLMTSDEGDVQGYYDTEREAKDSLISAAVRALGGGDA